MESTILVGHFQQVIEKLNTVSAALSGAVVGTKVGSADIIKSDIPIRDKISQLSQYYN